MQTLLISPADGYEVVQLDRGKVNAIDAEMSGELLAYFKQAEHNQAIRGVVLTGRPHGFSAGLNIGKLLSSGPEYYDEFWRNYLSALQAMINFSKPFICAITGYAPAGACMLAATADYRIMGIGSPNKWNLSVRWKRRIEPVPDKRSTQISRRALAHGSYVQPK
jgi:3,2-trans-enoyl-CoA isomerase